MMRLIATALLTAILGLLALASPASAEHDEGLRPKCGDIRDGGGTLTLGAGVPNTSTPGLRKLEFKIKVRDDDCERFKYRLHVSDQPDSTAPLVVVDKRGDDDRKRVTFKVSVMDDDSNVCVYITSRDGKNRQRDRAPDTGCMVVGVPDQQVNGAPPGTFETPYDCVVMCDACAEFVSSATLTAGSSPVDIRLETAAASCTSVTYTVEVYDVADNSVVRAVSLLSNGTTRIDFIDMVDPQPGQTLSWRARSADASHVYDEGESGCVYSLQFGVVCARSFH
jgi:hypothetical protein